MLLISKFGAINSEGIPKYPNNQGNRNINSTNGKIDKFTRQKLFFFSINNAFTNHCKYVEFQLDRGWQKEISSIFYPILLAYR